MTFVCNFFIKTIKSLNFLNFTEQWTLHWPILDGKKDTTNTYYLDCVIWVKMLKVQAAHCPVVIQKINLCMCPFRSTCLFRRIYFTIKNRSKMRFLSKIILFVIRILSTLDSTSLWNKSYVHMFLRKSKLYFVENRRLSMCTLTVECHTGQI